MPRFTKKQLEERYQKLPQILKDALYSPDTAEKLFAIGRKNGLTIEEIGDAAEETGYVFLGLTRPQFFTDALKKRIDAEEKQIKQLASDINHQVFFPLREALKQAHEFDVSEEAIRKGEGLIAGLSKTAPPVAAPRPEPQRAAPATPVTGRFPPPGPKPIHPAPQEAATGRAWGGVPPSAEPTPQPTPPGAPIDQPPTPKPPPGTIVPPKRPPSFPGQTITIQPLKPAPMAPPAAPPKQTVPPLAPKQSVPSKPAPQPVMITKPPFSKPAAPPLAQPRPLSETPPAKPASEPQPMKPGPIAPPAPSSKVPPIDLRQQTKQPRPPPIQPPQQTSKPAQREIDPYREPIA